MALTFLVILLKVTLVLLAARAATLVMQRASAGSRHLVWLLALGSLLVLPAIAVWAPLRVPVLPQAVVADRGDKTDKAVRTDRAVVAGKADQADRFAALTVPSVPSDVSAPSVLSILISLWAAVALALLARLLFGTFSVRRIVRRGRKLEDGAWQTPLYEIADRLGLDDAPRLLQSSDVKMPFASGLLRPTIVLPAESESWSAGRRSAVLVHELGHIRRRDLLGHTLGRIASALYWFHPLVWTAARRLRAESEQACDDLALAFGAQPSDYAEHLLDIVTCVRDHNTPSIALAMAHRKEFEGRMLAILNPDLRRQGPGRVERTSYAFALVGVALLIGAAVPVARQSRDAGRGTRDLQRAVSDTLPAARPETLRTPVKHETSVATSTRTDTATASVNSSRLPDPRRAELLARTLHDDANADVRRIAAWGLQRYAENDVAINALIAAVGGDADARVREMSAWALADAPRRSAASAALARALHDGDANVRATAVWALGNIGDAGSVSALAGLLKDGDPSIRETAAWSIGQCDPGKAPAELTGLLTDGNRDVRLSAAWALFEIEDPSAGPALVAALRKETDHDVQVGMIRALGAMGDDAVDALQQVISSPDTTLRSVAIAALAGGGATGPWPWPRPEPRPYP